MTEYFDSLELRDPEVREASQFSLLPNLIRRAINRGPGWKEHLAGIDPANISSRVALARLPVLRKSRLAEQQKSQPPLGGFETPGDGHLARLFESPGPIYEPQGVGADFWRCARALFAAGFRDGDIVHNTFSYHLTPGGWILDAGLRKLRCTVIPAGVGNTEQQIAAIAHFKPNGYVGVPDFLKVLLDKAHEIGADVSSFKKALVSGGALFPSLRQDYADRGISVSQAYATADLGVIAYESEASDSMIVDEGVIVEIVRPGTGDVVPDGEVGEVVVTSFNRDYPMIRLATGDLSAIMPGASPCGRTNLRIKGWMGRADQTTKIKGMFVHPQQIADIGKRHPEVARMRLVVTREGEQDRMKLVCLAEAREPSLREALEKTLQDVTKMSGTVTFVDEDSLPNDGLVIADERSYDTQ